MLSRKNYAYGENGERIEVLQINPGETIAEAEARANKRCFLERAIQIILSVLTNLITICFSQATAAIIPAAITWGAWNFFISSIFAIPEVSFKVCYITVLCLNCLFQKFSKNSFKAFGESRFNNKNDTEKEIIRAITIICSTVIYSIILFPVSANYVISHYISTFTNLQHINYWILVGGALILFLEVNLNLNSSAKENK